MCVSHGTLRHYGAGGLFHAVDDPYCDRYHLRMACVAAQLSHSPLRRSAGARRRCDRAVLCHADVWQDAAVSHIPSPQSVECVGWLGASDTLERLLSWQSVHRHGQADLPPVYCWLRRAFRACLSVVFRPYSVFALGKCR